MSKTIKVQTAAFDAFVTSTERHGEDLQRILEALQAAHVDRGSFGLMPASDDMHQAYTEQVDFCIDGLTEAEEVMTSVADAAATTKDNYVTCETGAVEMLSGGGS